MSKEKRFLFLVASFFSLVIFAGKSLSRTFDQGREKKVAMIKKIQRAFEQLKKKYLERGEHKGVRALNRRLVQIKRMKAFASMSASNKRVIEDAFTFLSKLDFDVVNGFANVSTAYSLKKDIMGLMEVVDKQIVKWSDNVRCAESVADKLKTKITDYAGTVTLKQEAAGRLKRLKVYTNTAIAEARTLKALLNKAFSEIFDRELYEGVLSAF
ncbi:MAG: hypothetical protein JW725_03845 [Candidatus Babeliaceae bacterium]|nr:hypothetical protein [Candidatus Babeliaceae bacterium]